MKAEGTLTLKQTQDKFGVSRATLWRILKKHGVEVVADPFDERVRLVRVIDVNRILKEAERIRRGIAA